VPWCVGVPVLLLGRASPVMWSEASMMSSCPRGRRPTPRARGVEDLGVELFLCGDPVVHLRVSALPRKVRPPGPTGPPGRRPRRLLAATERDDGCSQGEAEACRRPGRDATSLPPRSTRWRRRATPSCRRRSVARRIGRRGSGPDGWSASVGRVVTAAASASRTAHATARQRSAHGHRRPDRSPFQPRRAHR